MACVTRSAVDGSGRLLGLRLAPALPDRSGHADLFFAQPYHHAAFCCGLPRTDAPTGGGAQMSLGAGLGAGSLRA